MRWTLLACVGLAAVSLVLPSEPSYDPWAWLVWGREIAGLELDTSGGPSWKPLPVLFTLFFAPFGAISSDIPPALWLIVARAGAMLAVVLTFRLARRLAGGSAAAGVAAGTVGAIALMLTPQWLRYAAHGNELPLATALMLWGVERHLDGDRRAPLVLAFLACLLRPEVFPFLVAYGIYLWHGDPAQRRLLAGLAALLPMLWLVPEWIGSGNPLDAGRQATKEVSWSLTRRDQPWLAVLERMHSVAGLPVELGALAAAIFAAVRRERTILALFGAGLLWVVLIVVMTESGFSGNARYFAPAVVIACVLAGVGAVRLVGGARELHPAAGVALAVALAIAVVPFADLRTERLEKQARLAGDLVDRQSELSGAVSAAGGADRIAAPGTPSVNRVFMTRFAWEVEQSLGSIERSPGRGFVFTATGPGLGNGARVDHDAGPRPRLMRVGAWNVLGPGRFHQRPAPVRRPSEPAKTDS